MVQDSTLKRIVILTSGSDQIRSESRRDVSMDPIQALAQIALRRNVSGDIEKQTGPLIS